MKYQGTQNFSHQQTPKIGVLITNLGTPSAPTTQALRQYLAEFLSDPRVVEIPRILWKCILHGIILRIRPRRSAAAYRSIWTEQGSPLMNHTSNQARALHTLFDQDFSGSVVVDFAMRYGSPSISHTIHSMMRAGVRQLLVLPLYPQYSAATTGSTFDAIAQDFRQRRWLPDFRFISHYHDHPQYITAVAKRIEAHWEQHGKADKLIFSYHGVPLRYLKNGDPYHCECHKTSRLIAEELGLTSTEYLTCFQSRFGREEWLRPYTDETLKRLPEQGIKSVQVICPGFSSDCLETIEEIEVENRDYFMDAGGETFHYIPALNAEIDHIHMLATLIKENLLGWSIPNEQAGDECYRHYQALEQCTSDP